MSQSITKKIRWLQAQVRLRRFAVWSEPLLAAWVSNGSKTVWNRYGPVGLCESGVCAKLYLLANCTQHTFSWHVWNVMVCCIWKDIFGHVCPEHTQISSHICSVLSDSLLGSVRLPWRPDWCFLRERAKDVKRMRLWLKLTELLGTFWR